MNETANNDLTPPNTFELSAPHLRRAYLTRIPFAGLCFFSAGVAWVASNPLIAGILALVGSCFAIWVVRGLAWLTRKQPLVQISNGLMLVQLPMVGAMGARRVASLRMLRAITSGPRAFVVFSVRPFATVTLLKPWFKSPQEFEEFVHTIKPMALESLTAPRREAVVPVLTFGLMVVLLSVQILAAPFDLIETSSIERLMSFGALSPALVLLGEWDRLITGGFIHAHWLHLLSNIIIMAATFAELEPTIGRIRTLLLMSVGCISASLVGVVFSSYEVMVGASGMGYAGIGALAFLLAFRRRSAPFNYRAQSRIFLAVMLVIDLSIAAFSRGISLSMHLGGFVGGFATAWILQQAEGIDSATVPRAIKLSAIAGLAVVFTALAWRAQLVLSSQAIAQLRANMLASHSFQLVNDAAYFMALDPDTVPQKLEFALTKVNSLIPNVENPRQLSNVLDTAAVLAYRLKDYRLAQRYGEEAISAQLRGAADAALLQQLSGRLTLYEFALMNKLALEAVETPQFTIDGTTTCISVPVPVGIRAVEVEDGTVAAVVHGDVKSRSCVDGVHRNLRVISLGKPQYQYELRYQRLYKSAPLLPEILQ